jgi:hypothetical protein
VANKLRFRRNGASLLAKAFGVGFIDWLNEVAVYFCEGQCEPQP